MTIKEAVIFSLPLTALLSGVREGRGDTGSTIDGVKLGASLGVKLPSGVAEGDEPEGLLLGVSELGAALGPDEGVSL